jgi:hypothetical protein
MFELLALLTPAERAAGLTGSGASASLTAQALSARCVNSLNTDFSSANSIGTVNQTISSTGGVSNAAGNITGRRERLCRILCRICGLYVTTVLVTFSSAEKAEMFKKPNKYKVFSGRGGGI